MVGVLSFLKGINMQLATFVLAILQISRDIICFCVILLTLLISFGQMFFTLMAPGTCGVEPEEPSCSQAEYYLRMYSMLIFQEFDRESYDSYVSVVLVVLYSFMVVLVLLNVLIAVASESYEKCLVRSQNLFGRARIHYLKKEMNRIADEQRALSTEHIHNLETSLREEIAKLESSFDLLKQDVSKPSAVAPEDIPSMLGVAIEALQKVQKTIR